MHIFEINTSPSVYLRHLENLKYGKGGVTGEGGVLVTQDRMTDANAAKVCANATVDATNSSDSSKIDNQKIDVKRGIGKPCAISIALYLFVSLIQQALRDSQSDGQGEDTGKFDATIGTEKEAKKEATKADTNENPT